MGHAMNDTLVGPKDPDWMTVEETADHLGVSKDLIYREIKKGNFPALKVGDRCLVSRRGLVEAAVRAGSKVATE